MHLALFVCKHLMSVSELVCLSLDICLTCGLMT